MEWSPTVPRSASPIFSLHSASRVSEQKKNNTLRVCRARATFLSICLSVSSFWSFFLSLSFSIVLLSDEGRLQPPPPPPPSAQPLLCRSHLAVSLLIFELMVCHIMSHIRSSIGVMSIALAWLPFHHKSVQPILRSLKEELGSVITREINLSHDLFFYLICTWSPSSIYLQAGVCVMQDTGLLW